MTPEATLPPKKLPIAKLAVAGALGLVLVFLALRGVNFREAAGRGVAIMQGVGPWVFFAALTVLPAVGFPLSAFTITAGQIFGPLLTLPGVIAATLAAIAVNLALTYWLSRYALRPVLTRIVGRYGYTVPTITRANALSVILALRLTPGPPFFIQGYVLGIAEVPFRLYMVVSWLCTLPWAVGAIVLGKGIFTGQARLLITGVGVIVATVAVVHLVRGRYAKRGG